MPAQIVNNSLSSLFQFQEAKISLGYNVATGLIMALNPPARPCNLLSVDDNYASSGFSDAKLTTIV